MKLAWNGVAREVRIEGAAALLDGERIAVRPMFERNELVALEIDGVLLPVRVVRQGAEALVWCAGDVFRIETAGRRRGRAAEHEGDLLAPMPGRVRRTLVAPGDAVTRGQVVLILEAMKMEHAIRAPRDGVVTRLAHAEGDLVEAGAALAEVTAQPS
ncbi:MAG: biotin/lipoyl-containing protein [Thermoanaerobaculia bacterium]